MAKRTQIEPIKPTLGNCLSTGYMVANMQGHVEKPKRRGLSPVMRAALNDLKERKWIPQRYATIDDLWRALDLQAIRPQRYGQWRLTDVIAGSHHALDKVGFLVATDGHQCIIEQPNGKPFVCLLQNFEPTEKLELPEKSYADKKPRKQQVNIFANFIYE